MRAHGFVFTLLMLASIGYAGCAVDATEHDTTDAAEAAITLAERDPAMLVGADRDIGGRGGVTVAGDYERRMYDFSVVPRVAARTPHELDLVEVRNALVVPHTGTLAGVEIATMTETDCGVTCK